MNRPIENKKTGLILWSLGLLTVVWAALIVAPFLSQGLSGILTAFTNGINDPTAISWCADSPKTILIFLLIYGLGIGVYYAMKRNYRKGEEHGSAMGRPRQLSRQIVTKQAGQYPALANVRIGLDGRKHRATSNVWCWRSGAAKHVYASPTYAMQLRRRGTRPKVKSAGPPDICWSSRLRVRILDLLHTERSHGYNPFTYLRDDKDVLKLVGNIVHNTTPKGAQSNDPFWERAETALMEALILYLVHEAPPFEQNFPMVMEMIGAADVREEDEEYASVLDELFERLEMRDPEKF